jgi:hypothetical protein
LGCCQIWPGNPAVNVHSELRAAAQGRTSRLLVAGLQPVSPDELHLAVGPVLLGGRATPS